ncbi:hypothetical protein ACOSQ4_005104 [Xanthoceras sorbifolium]
MATAQTIIDVQYEKLSMTILGETIEFQLERELEEEQRLSSIGAEDDLKTSLGVEEELKRQEEPKLCPNKPPDPKPKFDENGGHEKLQWQQLGDIDAMHGEQNRQERIVGYATVGVLNVH